MIPKKYDKMLTITIDKTDFEYLINSSLDQEVKDIISNNSNNKFNTVYLTIDKLICETILNFLSDELSRIGFNKNDEPNELGIMLENIINEFSREIYNHDSN